MADSRCRYSYDARESFAQNEIDVTWFSQLKHIWGLWKKSERVSRTLHEYFQTTSNPYVSALVITQMCDDFKQAKPNSLCYTVMEEFTKWVRDKEDSFAHLLVSDVKLQAFYVITRQHNMSLVKMVCSVYKMLEENYIFIAPINQFLRNKQYKEACQVAAFLKLHDHFSIEDFLIPLVIQDKMNVAEEFLHGSFVHQKQLVLFLDNLLAQRNIGNEVEMLISKYDIPDAKKSKMLYKPLGKLVARLMKIYNLPRDLAPNLNRKRNEGALQFLVYKRYVQHTLGRDSFREMVYEATTANPNLQREVVIQVNLAGDVQEAVFWAREFGIPRAECPTRIQELLDSGPSFPTEEEENWDDNPGINFHTLSLSDSQIVLVDTPVKFREFLFEVSSAEIVGIDSEWKPQFGTMKNGLALVQVATHNRVYILDIILTGSHQDCSWEEAGAKLFGNEKIIKLGFGVSSDLNMMLQCLPNLERTVQNKNGYLDLTSLWKRLTKEFNFKFPYTAQEGGESLTYLVELCLGKCLDKSDQFSNWERRPLRESQIRYAALDAYCLIEVFDVLKENAERQEIPFRDICLELMAKTNNEVKKTHKSRRSRRVDGPPLEVVCPFEGPISVSELKMLCDKGLEGLGQQLRKVGIDTLTLNAVDSPERCIQIAKQDSRIVVVRGRSTYAKISQYVPRGFCYPVATETVHEQLREILQHFNIRVRQEDIFSRCKLCNGASFVKVSQSTMKILKSCVKVTITSPPLDNDDHNDYTGFSSESDGYSDDGLSPPIKSNSQVQKFVENVDINLCRTRKGVPIQVNVLPPECINSISEFNICEVCGRIYWDGSHFERFINGKMKDIICE
ncbi:hypothetical protein R5R35_013427 [Gryllus longicercus]|uniref:Exonuclease mut-7 homolog n=2 Tax=Gryllus longicercus TaxID=2509291 RepID=A0AAN9WUX4_9ORTH